MEEIKVIIKEPGQPMREALIKNELTEFKKLVGGYIETICPLENKNIVTVVNDNGKLKKLAPNFKCYNDTIVGTAVFTKSNDDGEFVSLIKIEIIQIEKFFKNIEIAELQGLIDSLINEQIFLDLEVAHLKEQLNQENQKHV